VLFWYEGKAKRAKAVGRFADKAQTALINKEAALRRATVTGAVPTSTAVESERRTTSDRDFPEAVNLYLSEVKRGKSKKTHLAYSVTLKGFSEACKAQSIELMTREDVLKYTDMLRDSGLTPRTIAN
jgi:hypothetical protein